ncbi:hypothetical protein [Castellaniella sp.]|uniref:hypothetical protein n=1 Tax=Castellaniella sp. TaxID=1955812 RepID=UPI002AFF44EA|nr:hypothetical protein [Castellaniella sp.]
MDHEEKFWVSLWSLVAVVAVTLILGLLLYNADKNQKIADMVKAGADPIIVSCAMGTVSEGTGASALCSLRASGAAK